MVFRSVTSLLALLTNVDRYIIVYILYVNAWRSAYSPTDFLSGQKLFVCSRISCCYELEMSTKAVIIQFIPAQCLKPVSIILIIMLLTRACLCLAISLFPVGSA